MPMPLKYLLSAESSDPSHLSLPPRPASRVSNDERELGWTPASVACGMDTFMTMTLHGQEQIPETLLRVSSLLKGSQEQLWGLSS